MTRGDHRAQLRPVVVYAGLLSAWTAVVFLVCLFAGAHAELGTVFLSGAVVFGVSAVLHAGPMVCSFVAHRLAGDGLPLRRVWALTTTTPGGRGVLFWCLLGLLVLVVITTLHVLLAVASGLVACRGPQSIASAVASVPPIAVGMVIVGFGSEVGWRGFCQHYLAWLGPWRLAFVVALSWALLTLPMSLLQTINGGSPARATVSVALMGFVSSFLFSALCWRSGSVWPSVLGHGVMETVLVFVYDGVLTPVAQLSDQRFWTFQLVGLLVYAGITFVLMSHRSDPADGSGLPDLGVFSGRDARGQPFQRP